MDTQIQQALSRLHHQGQTVSLATLKGQLSSNYPMPVLIQAVKQYKQSPATVLELPLEAANNTPTAEEDDRLARLERQIEALTARIEHLEAKQR
ncbi:hypothetical protein SAMN04488540_102120 [Ferrimonas sediminum]|uniref:KfrA N-terminal DNA-binding domain-containing protein n=1 Tax=Ferrimonas sediminum TaxID=718193 RepID=A0A1G8LNE8_9GAMM|nr:lipase chaperone [Ferrimonas sediminum]SDI57239.1 hypothetical protein SAMN04488540_102120 [Ferrimonas sediminum]